MPGTAAERHVVHLAMPALGVGAQVVHVQLHVAGRERAPDHTDTERTREHLGKDREHVKADHTVSSVHGVTVTRARRDVDGRHVVARHRQPVDARCRRG